MSNRATLYPSSPRHDLATRQTLEIDIGRESIAEALQFKAFTDSPDEPPSREGQLLSLLMDPTYANESIPSLMKKCGLLLPEILDVLRKRDLALAVAHSGRRIGSVLDGLGEAAEPRTAVCTSCWGEGEIEDKRGGGDPLPHEPGEDPIYPTVPCPAAGCVEGSVRVPGNIDAAKLFLSVQGLIKSGGGGGVPNITVNANAQAGARAGADSGSDRKAQQQETVTTRVQDALEGRSTNNG